MLFRTKSETEAEKHHRKHQAGFFGGEVGALLKGTGYLDSTSTTIKEHVKLNKSVFSTESASFWFVGFLLFEVRT